MKTISSIYRQRGRAIAAAVISVCHFRRISRFEGRWQYLGTCGSAVSTIGKVNDQTETFPEAYGARNKGDVIEGGGEALPG